MQEAQLELVGEQHALKWDSTRCPRGYLRLKYVGKSNPSEAKHRVRLEQRRRTRQLFMTLGSALELG